MQTAPTPPVDYTKIQPITTDTHGNPNSGGVIKGWNAADDKAGAYNNIDGKITYPTPTVVTSAPAAAAVQSAQQKLAAATTPPPAPAPTPNGNGTPTQTTPAPTPKGPGNPNVNNGNPTYPAGSMVDKGSGAVQTPLNAGQIGVYQDPTTGQPTYYDDQGNVIAPPTDTSAVVSLTQPPTNAQGTQGAPTGNNGNMIPGTTIPSTGDPTTDTIISNLQSEINQKQTDAATMMDTLNSFMAKMDQQNADLLTQIGESYDAQVTSEQQVNAAQVAGATQIGIRSGLSMYAPELYQSKIKAVMDAGTAKISDILSKKAIALAKAQAANSKEDWTMLHQSMQDYEKAQTDLTNTTVKLLQEVQTQKKITDAEAKQQIADQKTQQDQTTKEATAHAWAVLSALDAEAGVKGESTMAQDIAAVQSYAATNGLDPQKLLAAVEQMKQTKDQYGSTPEAQYRFYSDTVNSIGGTPMSFNDWQASSQYNKTAATQKAKQDYPTSSAAAKKKSGTSLTSSQYAKLNSVGVDSGLADKLTAAILSGASLDAIRAALRTDGVDPKVLDEYDNAIGIAKLLKTQKPSTSGASTSFK